LCRLLDFEDVLNKVELEQLTIYNNIVTDVGALEIARRLNSDSKLRILNLQMNFIKDNGG